jgi:hypothetical protein
MSDTLTDKHYDWASNFVQMAIAEPIGGAVGKRGVTGDHFADR